jgi:hypothetical protein
MLRKVVLGLAVLLAALGVALLSRQLWAPGFQVLGSAALIFVCTAFERWRYRKAPAPPGARWQRTEERFADPISGEELEVQYDPVSGERRYVRRG